MKKLLSLLLILFTFSTITSGQPVAAVKNQKITLQTAEPNLSADLLESSALIISGRLKSIGLDDCLIKTNLALKQIVVTLPNGVNTQFIAKLATQKGVLEFYETWNYNSIAEMTDAVKISRLLGSGAPAGSSAELGCTTGSKVAIVNDYLKTTALGNKCRFLWNDLFDDKEVCLYAVRSVNTTGARLRGSDIQSITVREGTSGDQGSIDLKFKQEVVGQWAEITRKNIGNSIAIVLDEKVVFAPVLKSEIKGGNCQITGKFSPEQLKFLAAIASNGALASGFTQVK